MRGAKKPRTTRLPELDGCPSRFSESRGDSNARRLPSQGSDPLSEATDRCVIRVGAEHDQNRVIRRQPLSPSNPDARRDAKPSCDMFTFWVPPPGVPLCAHGRKELENDTLGDPPESFPLVEVKRVWSDKDRKTRNIYSLLLQPGL